MRPTWAEVSLSALQRNFETVAGHVGRNVTVCSVVKADAYGHGAVECSRALEAGGCKWFGVSSAEEGILLRNSGIRGRILLMAGFWEGEEESIIEHALTPAVWDASQIERLEAAARKHIAGGKETPRVSVHVKVDTGMSRLGIAPSDIPKVLPILKAAKHVALEGIFTHFASAEIIDCTQTNDQISRFNAAVGELQKSGGSVHYRHLANSAAIACRTDVLGNMVRPGISLYGYFLPFTSENGATSASQLPVKPVLSWKTRIHAIRDVPANHPISYGATYLTKSPARIAVLPVGYADGLRRELSSRSRVIVGNRYAPMVGRVTMDMTMVDVTDVPGVQVGSEVILIGSSAGKEITAWEHARIAETIPYEILCGLSKRVPRRYVESDVLPGK
jgi:alanine racemase